jgi:hypothetical protein
VVRGLLAGLARAGETFVGPEALRPVQERLIGSLRAQLGFPAAAAAILAVNRILDLPDSLMVTYAERVRRIGPQDLREVAAEHLDTSRVSVVVVGDATLLLPELLSLGPFELVDGAGAPLARSDLEPVEEVSLDAGALAPVTLEYGVMVGERQEGTVTRTLEAGPDSPSGSMTFRATAELGAQQVTQTLTFTVPDFRPVAAGASVLAAGRTAEMEISVDGGRLTGRVASAEGPRDLDLDFPDGALVGDMVELAAWLVPFEEGRAFRFVVVAPETGEVSPAVLRVGPTEEVTVPAGTFLTRRIELDGDQPQTYWVRVEPPRVPVKIAPAGRPVTLELVSISYPPAG